MKFFHPQTSIFILQNQQFLNNHCMIDIKEKNISSLLIQASCLITPRLLIQEN